MKTVFGFFLLFAGLAEIWAGWDNLLLTTQLFRNCASNTTYPNPFTNIDIAYGGEDGSIYVNCSLKVTHTVSHGAKIEIVTIKCLIPTDETSCRFYRSVEVEFCTYLFGNPFLQKWVKPIQNFGPCPILPGVYPVINMPLDFSNPGPWRAINDPEQYIGHWKMEVRFLSGNILETCMELEGDVKKKRRKSKKNPLSPLDAITKQK